jgi:Arc/MetJ family transcription regulator
MNRTNVGLNDALVKKAMRYTGARTKRQVIEIALESLVREGETYAKLLALGGKLRWEGDVNALRKASRCTW